MPLYDYLCRTCGHEFEALVMGGEQPACPLCGGSDLQKRMSSFSSPGSGRASTGDPGGCAGCSGGNCASCR